MLKQQLKLTLYVQHSRLYNTHRRAVRQRLGRHRLSTRRRPRPPAEARRTRRATTWRSIYRRTTTPDDSIWRRRRRRRRWPLTSRTSAATSFYATGSLTYVYAVTLNYQSDKYGDLGKLYRLIAAQRGTVAWSQFKAVCWVSLLNIVIERSNSNAKAYGLEYTGRDIFQTKYLWL